IEGVPNAKKKKYPGYKDFFYGSHDTSFLSPENIVPYTDGNLCIHGVPHLRNKCFNAALLEIVPNDTECEIKDVKLGEIQEPEQPNQQSRFHNPSESEISKLEDSRHETTTKTQTKWAIKIVTEWCTEQLKMTLDDMISSESFPEHLRESYASVQQKNGDNYSKSALNSIRAGIQRYLDNRGISMDLSGNTFSAANRVLKGLIKVLKREGKDTATHKEVIDEGDMTSLKEYFERF
ncbi:unnamed protein product, partial [Owenia fusiformis]